jgi:hypothetical protein
MEDSGREHQLEGEVESIGGIASTTATGASSASAAVLRTYVRPTHLPCCRIPTAVCPNTRTLRALCVGPSCGLVLSFTPWSGTRAPH